MEIRRVITLPTLFPRCRRDKVVGCDVRCRTSTMAACSCSCRGASHGSSVRGIGIPAVSQFVGDILDEIQPSNLSEETLQKRRVAILEVLRDSLEVKEVRPIGSHTRGTALRSSDADFLCIIPRRALRKRKISDSNQVLELVGRIVGERYPRTERRPDGQALTLDFDNLAVDLVPATFKRPVGPEKGYPVYEIPDGDGGWMETSPDTIGQFLNEADEASHGRLKAIARGIKSWRGRKEAAKLLSGLWIEVTLAQAQLPMEVGMTRTQTLAMAFQALATRNLAPAIDPSGIAKLRACPPSYRDAIQEQLAEASLMAAEAWRLEGEVPQEAQHAWRALLLGQQPNPAQIPQILA